MNPPPSAVASALTAPIAQSYTGNHLDTCPEIVIQTIFEQLEFNSLAELLKLTLVNTRFLTIIHQNQTGITALKRLNLYIDTSEWSERLKKEQWIPLYREYLNTPPPILLLDYSLSMTKPSKFMTQDSGDIHLKRAVHIAAQIGERIFDSFRPEVVVCLFAATHFIQHFDTMVEFEGFLMQYEAGSIQIGRTETEIVPAINAVFENIISATQNSTTKAFSIDLITDFKFKIRYLENTIDTALETHGFSPDLSSCQLTIHPTFTYQEVENRKKRHMLDLVEKIEGEDETNPQNRKISIHLASHAKRQKMVPEPDLEVLALPETPSPPAWEPEVVVIEELELATNNQPPYGNDPDFNTENWP